MKSIIHMFIVVISILITTQIIFSQERYSKVSIPISSREDALKIAKLGISLEGTSNKQKDRIDIFVSDWEIQLLNENGIGFTTLIPDWQKYYEERQKQETVDATALLRESPLTNFHLGSMGGFLTFNELVAELDSMRAKYPSLISAKDSLGASYEKRPIWAVRISKNPTPGSNPQALYMGLHHGNEPAGMMSLVYFMWYLLEHYGTDPEVTMLLDTRELYFVPIVNPDGYCYNEKKQPNGGGVWRKNRKPGSGGVVGVNLNRNYGYKWGFDDIGSSPQNSSTEYRGTEPFSEPETQVIRDFVNAHNFTASHSFHSYAGFIVQPWVYNLSATPDSVLFTSLGSEMASLNGYSYGKFFYTANGSEIDWIYGDTIRNQKTLSFVVEVGADADGFWPPITRILPLVKENIYPNLVLARAAGTYMQINKHDVLYRYTTDSAFISVPFINSSAGMPPNLIDIKISCPDLDFVATQYNGYDWNTLGPLKISARKKRPAGTKVSMLFELNYQGGTTTNSLTFLLGPDDSTEVIFTVGKGGDFQTLDDLFASLTKYGIIRPVTLSLIDTLYDATTNPTGSYKLTGPIAGAGPKNRITIRPADNVAVTIKGNGRAVLLFENVCHLTVDGVNLQGNTRLKVHALLNPTISNNEGIIFMGNSDFNIVRNLTACTDEIGNLSGAIGLYGYGNMVSDNCLISGVAVTSGGIGIYVIGNGYVYATGNVVRDNHIGSPSDSLIAWGIQNVSSEGTIIENNHIENLRYHDNTYNAQLGINTYLVRNIIIRNNLIHNLCGKKNGSMILGIITSGSADVSDRSPNSWIYNNKVWDIENKATQVKRMAGIFVEVQDSIKVDYNSVYLTECGDVPSAVGSSAIWVLGDNVFPTVRNNILVNTRNDSPYVSTAIRMDAPTSVSDYNDLYVGTSSSANIAKRNATLYKTLANWQGASKDLHSISMCPIFCTTALHIDTTNAISNALEGKGTPIAGILTDFEGQPRNATTPDIGADEFAKVPSGSVEDEGTTPETFALLQNYPNPFNPSTTIRYSLPTSANVKLTIYDLLGREIATLVNEEQLAGWKEVEWNASTFSSGIYFYKLSAGNYVGVKKLMLLK